jgi:hypothetical protein
MASIKTISSVQTHADGLSVGVTSEKLGFLGATPIVRPVSADQAIATDTASTLTLANSLRLALVNLGLIKGAA